MERMPKRKINPDYKPPAVRKNMIAGDTAALSAQGRKGAEVVNLKRAHARENALYEAEMISLKKAEEAGSWILDPEEDTDLPPEN